ncbi:hypothetical protein [Alkalibacillus haloalkaliphilus]|uniref:hypothetical protein n=1 Tax=Alkalibacillus haloalkaliphilus TaxID=94136 RepID=UPI0029367AB9|nr:hypothetical protein [Alkalibacillus haloalkaliphilus]MDV2582962.1 hypothetical protein [Alkalibacillus haloalkaliphilus]
MKEIYTETIQLENQLTMYEILSLHDYNQTVDGDFYFITEHYVVAPRNLPKLVSTFLTLDETSELKVVIEGYDVNQIFTDIKACIKEEEAEKVALV